eukprot:GFUD01090827.1.p1 GENE.GFUD01090827.1~~GFUD01090827.1.p1  ORF type:complete len:231 (-),score=51.19 GFUD01090827.1:254-946(-)
MGWSGIELYYTPGSPHCRAVLMCIKALELDVDLIKLDMYQKYEHKKPWFVKMNPQHTVPTLNDNEYILWESRAILCYLVNKFGSSCPKKSQLYPTDPEMRANVDRLLYFDTGTLYKNIVDYFHPQLMSGEYPDDRKANALKQSLEYIDLFLEKTSYCAGPQLTIADFSILASVTQLEGMDYKITAYQNLFAWVEKLKSELPYYEDCNSAGIEMFRAWAKSKNKSYDSKGK